jgi:hypothetical protein
MKKIVANTIILISFLVASPVIAQVSIKDSAVATFMVRVSYSYNWPGGDLVNRFGNNSTVGGSFGIKLKSNLQINLLYNYIFGRSVKEYEILDGLRTEDGFIITEAGTPSETDMFERGYSLFLTAGVVVPKIPLTKIKLSLNPNSGFVFSIGPGFLQHRIRIESDAAPLRGAYKKGYDRLSNGIAIMESFGYLFLSNKRLINFYIGMTSVQAWTKNRRGFNFDTGKEDNEMRLDIMTGFKAAWILPLYKKVPDAYYFY